jgi:hypothetical protein
MLVKGRRKGRVSSTRIGRVIGGRVMRVGVGIAEAVVLAVLELPAVGNYNRAHRGIARRGLRVLHTADDAHALQHLRIRIIITTRPGNKTGNVSTNPQRSFTRPL